MTAEASIRAALEAIKAPKDFGWATERWEEGVTPSNITALLEELDACRKLKNIWESAFRESNERAEAAEQALRDLDSRLRSCFLFDITAKEAYDSFYQEIVAAALAQSTTKEG